MITIKELLTLTAQQIDALVYDGEVPHIIIEDGRVKGYDL